MAENAQAQAETHGGGHGHGVRHYYKIYFILLALLVVSVAGPFLGIQIVTLITAFGIAIVKAYLVAANFMHLNIERRYVIYMLVTAVVFMLLLFAGVAPDVMNHEGQNWVNVAAQAAAGGGEAEAAGGEWTAPTAYANMCSACHGANGGGDGAAAAALNPHPANFTDATFWETRDREHIRTVIRDGGASVGKSPLMVGFGGMLDDEQLDALTDHVMGFAPSGS